MKNTFLFTIALIVFSQNSFAKDNFWNGVFWGGVLSSSVSSTTAPTASEIVNEQERRKALAEVEATIAKFKAEKNAFCGGGFFSEIKNDIKSGNSNLLQVKHKGTLNVRYVFKNPKDTKDPLQVKIENPSFEAERALYTKYHTVNKEKHTISVGKKTYRYLPESFDYYSEGVKPKNITAADKIRKTLSSTDPTLRVITISTSKGSLTYNVLNGKIISIMNNTAGKDIPVEPKTESDIATLREAKTAFNNVAGEVELLESSIDYCTTPENGKLDVLSSEREKSDDHIRARRKFFAGFQDATRSAQSRTELAADANGIIPHPCHNSNGVPFNKFYGFKVIDGNLVKYKSAGAEGKVHTGGNGKAVSYATVTQFLEENGVECPSAADAVEAAGKETLPK
jgi:hypothetical protein